MRKALVLVGVLALGIVATGCFGPVSTHTIDATMSCSAQIGPGGMGPPNHPYADETAHISMDVPAWANPGETIPLSHITVTGLSFPAEGGAIPAGAVPGGTPVHFSFDLPGPFPSGTSPTQFDLIKPANDDGSLPTDLGSKTVTIPTDATGTYAIHLLSVSASWFISGGIAQTNARLCLPKTDDTIATVNIQGSPVTTAQTN
jgi:hypothetical protein